MSLQTLGVIAVAALCAGMLWTAAKRFYVAYCFRTGNIIRGEVMLPDELMPETLSAVDTKIRILGFEQRFTMKRGLVGVTPTNTTWVYVHPAFNMELSLIETPGEPPFTLAIETSFADGALLIMAYPRGYSVEAPMVTARYAVYSLQDAFDHHLLTQLAWTEAHGEPQPIETEHDAYFVAGRAAIKRHSRDLYGPIIRAQTGSGVAMIGYMLVVLGLASQLMAGDTFFNFNFLTATTLSLLAGLALAVGGNGWANRGKMLPAVDADKAPAIDPKVHPLNRPVQMS